MTEQKFRDRFGSVRSPEIGHAADWLVVRIQAAALALAPDRWGALIAYVFEPFRDFGRTLQQKWAVYPHRSFVVAIILGSIVLRALFVITYPLNTRGLDAHSYFAHMLLVGESNLVHLGGSTFILEILLWPLPGISALGNSLALFKIQLVQLALEVAALAFLIIAATDIFGRTVAALVALLCETNLLVLGFASTVHPQSLNASLFIIALCAAYLAAVQSDRNLKPALYTIAGLALLWSFYVRPSVLFLTPLVVFPLLMDRSPARWRFVAPFMTLAIATSLPFFAWHYVTTGTFTLKYDKGWFLVGKLAGDFGNDAVRPEYGIHSKRFLSLIAVLPVDLKGANALTYRHVDAVSREDRNERRLAWGWMLTADHKRLDANVYYQKLPANFSLSYAPTTIAYYIGLREAEQLGVGVFSEWVRSNPLRFLWTGVLKNIWHGLVAFPTPSLMPIKPVERFGFTEAASSRGLFGFQKLEPIKSRTDNRFDSDSNVVWGPGLSFFTALRFLTPPPAIIALLSAIAIGAAAMTIYRGNTDTEAIAVLAVSFSVVLYVAAISTISHLRFQDSRIIYPLYALIASYGLVTIVRIVKNTVINRGAAKR